jgi:hyperosmotically inducible protein
MHLNKLHRGLLTGSLFLGIVAGTAAQDAPDNTKVNQRDRSSGQPTADQAKNNLTDRQIMQNIRKAVVADKSLSVYGHNAKIISEHGKVTLKGPVHSEEERKNIEAKATEVAGAGNVTNQLSVKTDK